MNVTIPFVNIQFEIPLTSIFLNLVYSIVIFILGKMVVKTTNYTIEKIDEIAEKRGLKKLDISEHGKFLLKTFAKYLIWFFAIMGILYIWGLKDVVVTALTGAGVAGIVVGFASKDVFSNLISGILIIFDKPFKIGDAILVGDKGGVVKEISLRSTKLTSFEGVPITIPNSMLSSCVITNFSRSRKRRLDLKVGVGFKTNLPKALKYLQEALKKRDWFLKEPAPVVFIENFGASSVDLIVRVWITPKDYLDKKTKFYELVKKVLDKHKIEMPFPHQVMIQKRR